MKWYMFDIGRKQKWLSYNLNECKLWELGRVKQSKKHVIVSISFSNVFFSNDLK